MNTDSMESLRQSIKELDQQKESKGREEIRMTVEEVRNLLTAGNKIGYHLDRGNVNMARQHAEFLTGLTYEKLAECWRMRTEQGAEEVSVEPLGHNPWHRYCSQRETTGSPMTSSDMTNAADKAATSMRVLYITSYCDECSDQLPCIECLKMSNVVDVLGHITKNHGGWDYLKKLKGDEQ